MTTIAEALIVQRKWIERIVTVVDDSKTIQGLRHRLSLYKLPNGHLRTNAEGQSCRYELTYKWYNADGGVQGSELLLYPASEMKKIVAAIQAGESIFDHFNLF